MAKTAERTGLRRWQTAPAFTVRDLRHGGTISLASYRGQRLFLLFSDPGCPVCDAIMPWLESIHVAPRNVLAVLMISRGSPAPTWGKVQQFGLTLPVGLQRHWEVSDAYAYVGTPVGYAIGADGKLEADMAAGAEPVQALGNWMAYG